MKENHPLAIVVFVCSTILTISCNHSCKESEARFRQKSYYFKIERYVKEQEKINIFEGTGESGRKEVFANVGLGNVYDNAIVGDSLIKAKGSTDVVIIHNGQRTVFDCSCHQKN